MANKVRIEFILNRRVRALNGRVIGRLEEIRAESSDDACYVTEYLVGAYAFFERFAALRLAQGVLRLIRLNKRGVGYRVRWDQLDLTNPARPTLRREIDELSSIDKTID